MIITQEQTEALFPEQQIMSLDFHIVKWGKKKKKNHYASYKNQP